MTSRAASRVLLVCPIALFVLSVVTTKLQGPSYLGLNSDPEYAYLLNALNVATLRVPGLWAHPGTTLQVVGALVILGKWAAACLVGPWESLEESVLRHPEAYLHATGLVLNLLLAGAIYVVARRIYQLSESLLAALVFQISFALFVETVHAQARPNPELMLAISVVILALPLAPMAVGRDTRLTESEERWLAMATGAALAFGIVTKITFAPLVFVCLLFRTWKAKLVCLVSCVAGVLALLFPIWTHFSKMSIWFSSLLIHKERYGGGPVGVPDATSLLANLATILRHEPVLVWLVLFYVASYAAIRAGWIHAPNQETAQVTRLLLVGVLVITVQIAITIKHFALHYLLPAMTFTMLVNAALIFLFTRSGTSKASRALCGLMVLVLAFGTLHSYRWLGVWTALWSQHRANAALLLQRRQQMKDCTVIGHYRSSLQEFALSFGDDWTGHVYGRALSEIYPQSVHYNIWAHEFYSMAKEAKGEDIRRAVAGGACYLMQGTPLSKEDRDLLSGFSLTPVVVAVIEGEAVRPLLAWIGDAGNEGLYRLGLSASRAAIPDAAESVGR